MASLKKNFRGELVTVARSASDLLLLSEGLSALEPVEALAKSVLQACDQLSQLAKQMPKQGFAEQMVHEPALFELVEQMDSDVMSMIEECFSGLGDEHNAELGELLQQLLEKLEKQLKQVSEPIQQLVRLLNREI